MIVTRIFTFDAAHRLHNHPGLCRNIHGHTWTLEVSLKGSVKVPAGMVIDFGDLKRIVQTSIIDDLDHHYLGSWKGLHTDDELLRRSRVTWLPLDFLPTCENLLYAIFNRLIGDELFSRYLTSLKLWESPESWAMLVTKEFEDPTSV